MPESEHKAIEPRKYRFITIRQAVAKISETDDGGLERAGEMFEGHPVYRIFNNKSGGQLGILSYYRPWRQFVLSSQPECVFNDSCLRNVLDFMERINNA